MNAFVAATPLRLSAQPLRLPQQSSSTARRSRPVAAPLRRCSSGAATMVVDPATVSAATTQLLAENPAFLVKIADAFNSLGMPAKLVELGHPGMMTAMSLSLGLAGALAGWKGRLNEDKKAGVGQKKFHGDAMTAFLFLSALGGSGGTLSVAMQGYDVWQSPHAISGAVALLLMTANAVVARTGFNIGGDGSAKARLQGRTIHAYFGSAIVVAFAIHGALGASILLG